MKMRKILPNDFNFFPTTFMLPHDYKDFVEVAKNEKYSKTYIMKPED